MAFTDRLKHHRVLSTMFMVGLAYLLGACTEQQNVNATQTQPTSTSEHTAYVPPQATAAESAVQLSETPAPAATADILDILSSGPHITQVPGGEVFQFVSISGEVVTQYNVDSRFCNISPFLCWNTLETTYTQQILSAMKELGLDFSHEVSLASFVSSFTTPLPKDVLGNAMQLSFGESLNPETYMTQNRTALNALVVHLKDGETPSSFFQTPVNDIPLYQVLEQLETTSSDSMFRQFHDGTNFYYFDESGAKQQIHNTEACLYNYPFSGVTWATVQEDSTTGQPMFTILVSATARRGGDLKTEYLLWTFSSDPSYAEFRDMDGNIVYSGNLKMGDSTYEREGESLILEVPVSVLKSDCYTDSSVQDHQ